MEVKAIGEDVVFCLLLTSIEDYDAEHHTSAKELEEGARELFDAHPDIRSAKGITVHYQDTVFIQVDANICVSTNILTDQISIFVRRIEIFVNLQSNIEIW